MKKILLLLAAGGFSYHAAAQCNVTADATQMTITCGESVTLSHSGSTTGNISFQENFNNGATTGWAFTQQATFTNPCSPGGVDGTPHIWMGDQSGVPRTLETLPLNFGPSVAPAGGTICFDLLFSEQGDASPCEGPDEPDEGVYLQYSIDNGATWITINYFDPNGGNDPDLVNWNNWCFPIPAGALVNGVKFRWFQDADSGAEYDHWGIDNVEIIVNDPNVTYTWSHDGYTTNLPGTNPTPVAPHTTTTYTVTMSTSSGNCTQDITIVVNNPVVQVNAGPDLQVCAGQCVDLQATASVVNDPGGIKTFANNQTEDFSASSIGGGASVNVNIQDLNMTNVNPGSLVSICITNLEFTGGIFGGTGVETLSLTLECPSGQTMTLVPIGGAPAGNPGIAPFGLFADPSEYSNVCFVPSGGSALSSLTPNSPAVQPITGNYSSNQPFSNMDGCLANGLWTISVATNQISGNGTFDGWSITFDDEVDEYTPDILWSPTTYMTSGEQTTMNPTVCPDVNTTYTITASDTAGCVTVSDNVLVTTDGICCALTIDDIDINNGDCTSPNGSITITYSGETTGLEFSIDGGATFQSSNVFTNMAPGTYQVQILDDANCPSNQEIVLSATNAPVITNVATVNPTCGNTNGSITITASGGTGTLDYSINGGTTNQASNAFPNLGPQTYQVVVTDDNGCEATQSVQLITPNAPVINSATPVNTACGVSTGSITVQASGGVGTLDYSIDGGAAQATGTFNNLAADDYVITVTDDNGCEVSQTVTVAANPGPSITSVTPTAPNCGASDGSIVIVATGGAGALTYSIDNGTTTQASGTFNNLGAATYQVVVEDVNGCEATQQVILNTTNVPNVNAGPDVNICAGESVTLTATGAATYQWTGGITNGTPFTPPATTTYTVTGTDAAGCVNTDQVTVTVTPQPTAGFTPDVITGNPPLTVNFTNISTFGTGFVWNFGNGSAPVTTPNMTSQTSTFNTPGVYTVQLTATNGSCTDIFTFPITVLGFPPFEIHIPNVFTPNDDQANDDFFIDVKNGKSISVTIFNRWGNQMFEMDDFADRWDGKDASEGVYFFVYSITDLNNEVHEGHGHVTLVRE